jgi:hypothetical protein
MKMEQTECSETSAHKTQMPGNQKKAYNIQNVATVLRASYQINEISKSVFEVSFYYPTIIYVF